MSMTEQDLSNLISSLLEIKESNHEHANSSHNNSMNEQMQLRLGSLVNQSFPVNGRVTATTKNEGRKLVGTLSLGNPSSSVLSPATPSITGYSSGALSCLPHEAMFQFTNDDEQDYTEDDQQQQQQQVNRHRKLDRSASEPVSRGLASAFSSAKGSSGSGSSSGSSGGSSSVANSSFCRYKTELCRPYEENGSCKYGDKCQFAHGRHELRSLARHPKYKTDLCKTYHTTGLCPYGPRCHFIHNDEERQLNIVNRLVLEQKKTQAMYEQQRTQLVRQQQVIAAAVAAQKLLHQQQNPNQLMKQMSVDALMAAQQTYRSALQLQQQSSLQSRGSVGSASDSPSSSITDSPSPSPTSLMFDDPTTSAAAIASINLTNGQGRLSTSSSCWSSIEESTSSSSSSDALQTVLESLLKMNNSTSAGLVRPPFRDYIGGPSDGFACLQAASYLQ